MHRALCLLAAVLPLAAASGAVRAWREAHERVILSEFAGLLSIPNTDRKNLGRNAAHISAMLEKRGVKVRSIGVPAAPPVVYGELNTPGASRTLIFYAHYDGQPVEPAKWKTNAFQPVMPPAGRADPEFRIVARSASDDKAPIQALLSALDALRALGVRPRSNLKFFFEGEEETGSPHLEQIVSRDRDLLRGDAWIVCDGPVDQSRRQQLYFGARGVTTLDVTVYGPRRELHSGHYGNWAPNPAMRLAQLLAAMKDGAGKVLVPGFYEGIQPLGPAEKRALAEAPTNDAVLRRELGIGHADGGGQRLIDLINLPSLNVRGLSSGSVGDTARNVIPATATAALDIRLVKGMDWKRTADRVVEYIRRQGYYVVEAEPDEAVRMAHANVALVKRGPGYNAARTPMDLPVSKWVIAAVESARGPSVKLPTLGGSVPLYVFTDLLRTSAIGVPIANHDNNQHSANENLRVQNLWDGIETFAAILQAP